MLIELCARIVCTTKSYEEDEIFDDDSSIVHKIPDFIEFETETFGTGRETSSSTTYYEEICIDRSNILEHSLLSVNKQVNHINEMVEKEEEKKRSDDETHNIKNNELLKENDTKLLIENNEIPANKKSFQYSEISSSICSILIDTDNNNTNHMATFIENNEDGSDDEVRSSSKCINGQKSINTLLLEIEEINDLSNSIEEQIEIIFVEELIILAMQSKEEITKYHEIIISPTTIKTKLKFKDMANKVINENKKKKRKNEFAELAWQKIIEKRQEFVDENSIDYSKVRIMWKKGFVN